MKFLQDYFSNSSTVFAILFLLIAVIGLPLSAYAQMSADWEVHAPGGETRCADGSEFTYFTRQGDSKKVMIHFTGGGACWDGRQCDRSVNPTPYSFDVNKGVDPRNFAGIFNFERTDNPFKGYTTVVAPTCTGDVVLGDSTVTYRYENKEGEQAEAVTHHKGYPNGMATLSWVFEQITDPELIVVNGSSAGAVATPFYANIVANHYQDTRVIGIGDGAGSYREAAMSAANLESWNLGSGFSDHQAFKNLNSQSLGVENLYMAAADQGLPNLELYQMDQAYDRAQEYFLRLAGNENSDVWQLIRENRGEIATRYPAFRTFTIGGIEHTSFTRPRFYYYRSDNTLLRDWVADILEGKAVGNVTCTQCRQPELNFTDADLQIIEKVESYLSKNEKWNSNDRYREDYDCSDYSDKYSLRCAVKQASGGEDGSVAKYAVGDAILYAARERMANEDQEGANVPAVVSYNNQDGRTFEEIKSLVDKVAAQVRSQVSE